MKQETQSSVTSVKAAARQHGEFYEDEPEHKRRVVQVKNLRKVTTQALCCNSQRF